jgi:hypothetical protein
LNAETKRGGVRMSSIGGEYIGIPCGGEPLRRKANNITEAQKVALRKEGAAAERKRIASLIADMFCCHKGESFCDEYEVKSCPSCWREYLEPSQ